MEKRKKQSSKAEYLKKYDKAMGPLGSLGSALIPYAIIIGLFVAILMWVL
ncbi:MAG: hypothetical protein ACJ0OP_00455 [Thermodesulfobacteriota bacterium]|jgi:p-aminobenzoyl-glutamate transporter AbgT|tara:strand:+ start:222 stop:371 length:150 start_codon:yes stop_codon:yes gene_type:complete